jgi:hypothetical protein
MQLLLLLQSLLGTMERVPETEAVSILVKSAHTPASPLILIRLGADGSGMAPSNYPVQG